MAKPPPDPDLARRVEAAIAYGGRTQIEVAEALGISDGQLRRYLRAELPFDEAQLRTIAQLCDVSLRLLYEEFPPYDPPGELGRVLQGSPPNGPRHNR